MDEILFSDKGDDEENLILDEAVHSIQSGKNNLESTSYGYGSVEVVNELKQEEVKFSDLIPTASRISSQVDNVIELKVVKSGDGENPESSTNGSRAHTSEHQQKQKTKQIRRTLSHQSQADHWAEVKAKKREKIKLKEKIKSGWEVRQALLGNDDICPDDWYLEKVAERNVALVEALLKTASTSPLLQLNKNACSKMRKTALRIAIENQDSKMCKLLLDNDVLVRDCLFHAIEKNFESGVRLILKHEPSMCARIIDDNFNFPPGISPYCYAAWRNNYPMLKILHDHDFKLEKAKGWYEGIMFAWESSNDRKWYYEARSSPAYITLMTEVYHRDPLEECMKTIGELRVQARLEPMFFQRFKELQTQVEDYMCDLLDQVRSSEELSHIFEYDFIPVCDSKFAVRIRKNPMIRYHRSTVVKVLDKACETRLYKFVTHQYSQLAIDYLRYRHTPFLHSTYPQRDYLLKIFVGIFFPILSLFYIVNSKSTMGSWITYPPISFHCHMVSDMMFIAILYANLTYLVSHETSVYLGMPPNALETVAFFWVLGKWFQEMEELKKRGFRSYFSDWWNYNDLIYLVLFTLAAMFRLMDFNENFQNTEKITRDKWGGFEYRLIAESLQAYAYVFVVLRILGILRTDRTLGPLQVSLARMMVNIGQFLVIFALVILAFSMGFTEIFSYYSTEEGRLLLCNATSSSAGDCDAAADQIPFSTISESLNSLFWALFGEMQFEASVRKIDARHGMTWRVGFSLLIIYHITAVIVLINMLIAMMSLTYETTSSNSEREWKFNRTNAWIRFVRKEAVIPPPLNIIPSSIFILKKLTALLSRIRCRCCKESDPVPPQVMDNKKKALRKDRKSMKKKASFLTKTLGTQNRMKALERLVQRYKYRWLLKDS